MAAVHNDVLAQVSTWITHDPDPVTKAELSSLLDLAGGGPSTEQAAALEDLTQRFALPLEFGTAGLRGALAGGPGRMNQQTVRITAAAIARFATSHTNGEPAKIVIGYDARYKSADFARDSAGIFTAAGHEVWLLPRQLPTPVLAYATRALDADIGVMVTASHNPPQDNGYKVYLGGRIVSGSAAGAQLVSPYDKQIAELIGEYDHCGDIAVAADGWQIAPESLVDDYIDAAVNLIGTAGAVERDIHIAYTAMHGVGYETFAEATRRAGFTNITPVPSQQHPDPDFPTVSFPNPEEPGAMDEAMQTAQQVDAELIIASDPDADRCAVAIIDPHAGGTWRVLHGDELGALLAWRLTEKPLPDGNTLVNTIVSGDLLGKIAAARNLDYTKTLTGFKWISRAADIGFGYEEAIGYCVAPNLVRDKDGITAALVIADYAQELSRKSSCLADALDDLARHFGLYASAQVSLRMSEVSALSAAMVSLRNTPITAMGDWKITKVTDFLQAPTELRTDALQFDLEGGSRVIIRPSGTEPKVKCYLQVVTQVPDGASSDDITQLHTQARQQLHTLGELSLQLLESAG